MTVETRRADERAVQPKGRALIQASGYQNLDVKGENVMVTICSYFRI